MYALAVISIHMLKNTYMYIYIHMYMCIYIYTHIQIHTNLPPNWPLSAFTCCWHLLRSFRVGTSPDSNTCQTLARSFQVTRDTLKGDMNQRTKALHFTYSSSWIIPIPEKACVPSWKPPGLAMGSSSGTKIAGYLGCGSNNTSCNI